MKFLIALALALFGLPAFAVLDTGCDWSPTVPNQMDCPLVASATPIGKELTPGKYISFKNNTADYLQIDSVEAITYEQNWWSEFCVFQDVLMTGQPTPGTGEMGCTTKNRGENYPLIRWGTNTGLSVPPGSRVAIGSHTPPNEVAHTYSLKVRKQVTGVTVWRQPRMDTPIACNGMSQSSPWDVLVNNTGRDIHLIGAQIFNVSGTPATTNVLNGSACIYTFFQSGAIKYKNCGDGWKMRGEIEMDAQIIAPGEGVAAQAINACAVGDNWDWAAYLRVW
jgi:hypothetical protein